MTAEIIAIAGVAVAAIGAVSAFGWRLYVERGYRADSDADAATASQNADIAIAERNDLQRKLDALLAARAAAEQERAKNEIDHITAMGDDGVAIAIASDRVFASMPAPADPNPLGADPMPTATTAVAANAKRRR